MPFKHRASLPLRRIHAFWCPASQPTISVLGTIPSPPSALSRTEVGTASGGPTISWFPHLPILVGGNGEKRTLKTCAKYADIATSTSTIRAVRMCSSTRSQCLNATARTFSTIPAEIEPKTLDRMQQCQLLHQLARSIRGRGRRRDHVLQRTYET